MIWPEVPQGVSPALYYFCVGLSVLVIGVSKAGFGGGTGVLAVVISGVVMPPGQMLGMLLPILIAADILSNLHYLKEYEWRYLRPLLCGAAVGIGVGSVVFWMLQKGDPRTFQRALSLLVGVICLVMVGMQGWALTGRRVPTLPPGRMSILGMGTLAGFVSTITHSAGPLVSLYLLQEKLEKRRLVGTLVLFFLIVNVAKVPTFVHLGVINGRTLGDSIWLIPLLPAGTLLGAWMNRKVPERPFVVVMYAAAALTAGWMIWKELA